MGNNTLAIMGELSVNLGAVLRDESCTLLTLIYGRLSAHQRVKNPWVLEFTRNIPKELYSALKRVFSSTTNCDFWWNIHMDGNNKGFVISIGYLPFVFYVSHFDWKDSRTDGHRGKTFAISYKYFMQQLIVSCHFRSGTHMIKIVNV